METTAEHWKEDCEITYLEIGDLNTNNINTLIKKQYKN